MMTHETDMPEVSIEEPVLRAFGFDDPSDLPFDELAEAYIALSSGYLGAPSEPVADARIDGLIRGLMYGPRTHRIARALLGAYAHSGPMVELGSGLGPFGWAARSLQLATELLLIDQSQQLLDAALDVFEALQFELPSVARSDLRHSIPDLPKASSVVALPYSLGEIARGWDVRDRLDFLERLAESLAPDGRLFVVEPGTKSSARALQELRDAVSKSPTLRVVAPCTHSNACPRLSSESDWCHFTWAMELGPVGRRIADLARRRHSEVHFSWLVVAKEGGADLKKGTHRVLENRRSGPGKRMIRSCADSGESVLISLTRKKELEQTLETAAPGSILELDTNKLVRKGDGLHIGDLDGILSMKPI